VKKRFCLLLVILPAFIEAQEGPLPQSLPWTRLSSYQLKDASAFTFTYNKGALAFVKNFSAAIASERRFMLQELNQVNASLCLPSAMGNWGLMAEHFGNEGMAESVFGISYARKLGDAVGLGIQINYFSRNIPGYKMNSALQGEIGVVFKISEQVSSGIRISDPANMFFGTPGDGPASVFSGGMGYQLSEKVFLAADIQKMEEAPVQFQIGFQYSLIDKINMLGGVIPQTASWYLGAGFRSHSFWVTVSAGVHPYLGITPGISVMYKGN
jgi:hypothetical protein